MGGGGFRGGMPAGGGFRGGMPAGGGFRGGMPAGVSRGMTGGIRPNYPVGGAMRSPSMGMSRSFTPSMARGFGGAQMARPGINGAGMGMSRPGISGANLGMARNSYGFGARAPINSAGRFGGPSGFGRPAISSGGLAMGRNAFGLGTRPGINSTAGLGRSSSFGPLGANGAGRGIGITPTSLTRASISSNRSLNINNQSVNINRISSVNTLNSVNAWGGFGRGSGYGWGRNGYGGWGGYGYGRRYGFGSWGGYGYGRRYGFGRYGYGFGYPWYGYGFGYPFLGGLGFGLGYGLGFGLLGYGGYGYGGYGYGGYGLGYGGYGGYYGDYGLGYGSLYGSSLYDWGYSAYSNPYVSSSPLTVVVQPTVYDYSQPITNPSSPPQPGVIDQVASTFESARSAFKTGDYTQALELADQAIRQTPNEAALHEFRALVLFALGRYDEAAAALYAVLAVGPGWDWPTLIGLYADVSVYTGQLRALESYVNNNPQSASARLVLAYHYLTQGNTDAGLRQLKQVVALQPKDTLSARLIQQIETTQPPALSGPVQAQKLPAAPSGPPAAALPVKEGRLAGTWTAQPDKDTTITLTFVDQDRFTWQVTHQGQSRELKGKRVYGSGLLTLAQDEGAPMVGNITWRDETHFTFKVPGGAPDDPGLNFSKTG
jgi:tetratricopeptide (TPR) repeat protein